MSEDQLEFERGWSSAAGASSTMHGVEQEIRKRSAEYFVKGNDVLAKAFRDLADHFKTKAEELSVEVQVFIKKAAKRCLPNPQ